ncbi:MAG: PAS domain-containing protein [Alphaproteobacteria bacterium]|nr:PAS domain-containing protein [Alphaproteobacteria bacterium]
MDRDGLRERYDVLLSRLVVLADGAPRQRLESYGGPPATIPALVATADSLARQVDALTPQDMAGLGRILETADSMTALLQQGALETAHSELARHVALREHRQDSIFEILGYFVGIIASGGVFVGLLRIEVRGSRRLAAQAKAAEAAARASESRFRDVVDAGSDWVWETDCDHRFSFLTERLPQQSGEDTRSIVGRTREELYGGEADAEVWARHYTDLEARRPFRGFTFPYRDTAGRLRFSRVHGKPAFAADGSFVGYRGTGRDITPEIEAAGALEENRRLLHGIIDVVPVIVNVKDKDGRYILMNRHQAERFGVKAEDAIGRTALDVQEEETARYFMALDKKVLTTGRALPFFERTVVHRGAEVTWLTTKQPPRDAKGQVQHIATVSLDVTKLKKAERARAALSRHFSPNMVEELVSMDEGFGPVRALDVAVLFADMVGFTELCAELPAQEAFDLLRDYDALMTPIILGYDGTLDKYLGDGIMATFGTPQPGPRDATNALRCAREMLRAIDAWNAARAARGQFKVEAGIGLHYGSVLLGNVGDARRMELAVVGDTINVASRLEDLTRSLGTPMVASAELIAAVTRESVASEAELARLVRGGSQTLRGRKKAVSIWTLRPDG